MKSLVLFKRFLNNKTIIVDQIETYPIAVKEMINANEDIINKFLTEESKLNEIKKRENRYGNSVGENLYYKKFNELIFKIYNYLYEHQYNALIFHATRLLPEEKDKIKLEGLKAYSREEYLNQKLSILNKYGFNVDEIYNLWKYCLINQEDFNDNYLREKKIYFFYSLNAMAENSVFLLNWGGEVLHKLSLPKIDAVSAPYILIKRVNIHDLESFTVQEQIKSHIINKDKVKYKVDASHVFENDVKIDYIFETDEDCLHFKYI